VPDPQLGFSGEQIGPERIGEHPCIKAVILGAGDGMAVTEPVKFRVQGIHGKPAQRPRHDAALLTA
jgi:hypothetical protein